MADEKGIKFYLVDTPEGPQLEHLQAEAKKRDPNFQTIHVDTTKQPLMERLNDLMRRAHGAGEGAGPVTISRPSPKPGAIGTFAEGNEAPEGKWMGDSHLVTEGRACNVCLTRKEIEDWRASGMASVEVEELVQRITDPIHLSNLKAMIEEHETDLKAKKGKRK